MTELEIKIQKKGIPILILVHQMRYFLLGSYYCHARDQSLSIEL
uniref:Uncharacterized protein n=1 Tax=Arundo donax TaxID=35708 RepID=A0A0A9FBZ3_ARUDO